MCIRDRIDSLPHDIYVVVDRKSRSEKETSMVTFLIGKGFHNFATNTADINLINGTKVYINSLRDIAAAYDLELQITAQEEILKKNEKKTENLKDDGISLQKKKKKLDDEISQNIVDQNNQKAEAERQKQIMETLKNKRKSTAAAPTRN